MSGNTAARFNVLTLSQAELVDAACDRFETTWRAGDWPCIEAYLDAVSAPCRQTLLLELLKLELELRMNVGETPTADEYRVRFPDHAEAIGQIFAAVREPSGPLSTEPDDSLSGGSSADPDASTASLVPGQIGDSFHCDRVLGRQLGEYLIVDRLGSGGMGVVYRALQRSAGRFVALKLIKADWWGDSTDATSHEAEVRFRNEAQANAQLEHDHIVPVYEVGHVAGLLFFSMRLIKGRSLGQMILSDGPLPPRRAAYYIEAIARAIQYAHDKSVVHRDVKPGNIMVDENDRPILIDLGLAKSLEATEYTTLTGKALGTAEYMSPEQAKGQKDVSFLSDVYGLGATLFALLTGRPPFSGPNPMVVLRKVIDEEPAWPRECDKAVGKELKAICLKCLEKNADRRIPSAGELAVELKKYLSYERCKYTLPGPGTRLKKWVRRQPWRAAAAALAFLALLVAGSAWALNVRQSHEAARGFLEDVQNAALAELPAKIERMAGYRGWVVPGLRELLRNQPEGTEAQTRVWLALLPFEPERAGDLAKRLQSCGPEEHRVIRDALRNHWPDIAPKLRDVVTDVRADQGRRMCAAAGLIAHDGPNTPASSAWQELRLAPDPGPRVALLEFLVQSRVDPEILARRLEFEPDESVRRQVIQMLGALGNGQPPSGISQELPGRLIAMYRDHPDPGVHSSLGYLLQRWGMNAEVKSIDLELAGKERGKRRWYVTPAAITMAVIDLPAEVRSRLPEAGELPARFAIATIETPLELVLKSGAEYVKQRKEQYDNNAPDAPDLPADALSYSNAARLCNWLSEREGIPAAEWCYRPGRHEGVMILEPDYAKRRGYRLPTVPEWLFAARAGSDTNRYFGQDTTFSAHYAWHSLNSDGHTQPVGKLRPNDFGLFDVIGNVREWCHNTKLFPNAECTSCQSGSDPGPCEMQLEALVGGDFIASPEMQNALAERADRRFDTMLPHDPIVCAGFRVVKSEF
jgi:serine/threonine protein kinase